MNWLASIGTALGMELGAEDGITERERERGEKELLCGQKENWREEGELPCGCPQKILLNGILMK